MGCPVSTHICTGCEELLENVWEWMPNKYLRSLVVVALIDKIVDAYMTQITSTSKPFVSSALMMKDTLESDINNFVECFQAEIDEQNVEGPAIKDRSDVQSRFKKLSVLASFFSLRTSFETIDTDLDKWYRLAKGTFSNSETEFLKIFVNRCFVNVLKKDNQLKKKIDERLRILWEE